MKGKYVYIHIGYIIKYVLKNSIKKCNKLRSIITIRIEMQMMNGWHGKREGIESLVTGPVGMEADVWEVKCDLNPNERKI